MGLNFPNSPTIGAQWPSPPQAGVPVYQWDGEKWTAGPPAIPDGLVHYDIAQNLTATQHVQARQNIFAAPINALAYSGMQVNGGMDVSQERGTTATSGGGYIVDGWQYVAAGTGFTQSSQQFGITQFAALGYPNGFYSNTITAKAALAAGDIVCFNQLIEGYRAARLAFGTANAQPVTIAFWTAHHRPGTYSGSLRNNAADRSYVFTYTQNVADTAEYKTVTIPGDAIGTWLTTNSAGLQFTLSMASGGTYSTATVGSWVAGNFVASTSQVNGIAATSDIFRFTGVTVLPGSEAPTAARAPFIMRPYGDELLLCKRYWQQLPNIVVDTNVVSQSTVLPVEMRALPTVTGGGAGFTVGGASTKVLQFYQTTRAYQTLILDARL